MLKSIAEEFIKDFYSKNWLVRYGLYGQAYCYTNGIVI